MRKMMMVLGTAAMLPLGACGQGGLGGMFGGNSGTYANNGGYYDASRNYTQGNYQARTMNRNDTVYRGSDGRYYCKRDDGTTGAVVGGLAGGVLGNIIAPGGSKTLGTIIGAAGGAIAGQQIDKGDVQCK
ncbi:glycine zipper 2TM domain-containing protein [Stakelama sp. CBK3Z-3]|uniref:17 kDa surface antigen n=2 Tax=Stakelama flava TaxID=2860338 RepID=A0ABS6XNM8_9SPHN|nr:glycine zipper 2TM domain-containing protein [Stakelama flava]MBW4331006.1 glycine zipper 2TM domain-containing protein [Stakelama flava]